MRDDSDDTVFHTSLGRRTILKTSAAAGLIGVGTGTVTAENDTSSGQPSTNNEERDDINTKTANEDESTVLLIKDKNPWGNPENERVLAELGVAYDVTRSDTLSDFSTEIENGSYDVLLIASDQREDRFYERVLAHRETILGFVQNGGVLVGHMLTNSGGWPSELLPDGIVTQDDFSQYRSDDLTIASQDSPIVADVSDSGIDDWNYSTHGHFRDISDKTESIIHKSSNQSKHTYIEHSYGSGTILATEQTSEWRTHNKPDVAEQLLFNELEYAISGAADQPGEIVDTTFSGPSEAAPETEISISLDVESQQPVSGIALTLDDRFKNIEITNAGADTVQADNDLILYSEPLPESMTVEFSLTTPSDPWDEPLPIGPEIGLEGGEEVIAVDPYTISLENIEEPELFDIIITADDEVVAGDTASVELQATAAPDPISAFQINPAEQPDHVNDFDDLSVETTAATQVEDPGFVVYSEVQQEVTVEWQGSVPDTAEAGEEFTLAGDALNDPQDRQAFSHTVTVTDDPFEKYRNDDGEITDTGLLEAISDWRDNELSDVDLLDIISEWRDAGGNINRISDVMSQL